MVKQREMPPIIDNGWRPLEYYPNLSNVKRISFDTETYDPELKKCGAGWGRGVGNILGVSISVDDASWYFPLRHNLQKEYNIEISNCVLFLKDIFENPNIEKVGANITYDIGWLKYDLGINTKGKLHDVLMCESILYPGYTNNLDAIAERRGIGNKQTTELYDWLREYTGSREKDLRKYLYLAPSSYVAKYAEQDAYLPLKIYEQQIKEIEADAHLGNVLDIEMRLIPLLIEMRLRGVKVDYDAANRLKTQLQSEIDLANENIFKEYGVVPNVNASRSLADLFTKANIPFGYTEKGSPSFTSTFLEGLEHPLAKQIQLIKKNSKLISTFIDGYVFGTSIDGKIYTTFNQLKSDDSGAITGRFSSSNPNLQNIPSKGELGILTRNIFIPDEPNFKWRKYDYSQVEYRCFAHFAVGDGSDGIRYEYNKDPFIDYHNKAHDLVLDKTGIDLPRKLVKNINFGILYGLGKEKLAKGMHISMNEATEILNGYHTALPYVKATMNFYSKYADKYGEMRTYLGRRTLFDEFEIGLNGQKQRKGLYRSLNYLLQGSAADIMKIAMVTAYENGLLEKVGYPMITVHDELDFSDSGYTDEVFDAIQDVMEHCVDFSVPLIADGEIGDRWGSVEEIPHKKL